MERTFLASPNFELRMCRKALNETIASVMRNIPVQLINFTENREMTEHIETFTSLARDFTQMHSTPGHTPSAAANMPHTDVPTQTTHHDTAYTSRRSADLTRLQSARHPVGGTQRELIQSRLPAHRASRLAARDTMGSPPRRLGGCGGSAGTPPDVIVYVPTIPKFAHLMRQSGHLANSGWAGRFEASSRAEYLQPAGKEVVRRRKGNSREECYRPSYPGVRRCPSGLDAYRSSQYQPSTSSETLIMSEEC